MKTEAFQNADVKSVTYCLFHQRFSGVFSVDDRRKRIKNMQYQMKIKALVWTGENDTKTLVWEIILSFLFVEATTDTFEKH